MARTVRTSRIDALALALALAGIPAAWAAKCDLKPGITGQQGRAGLCKFDPQTGSFEGTPAQQAACLTREVKRLGNIGNETITPFLKDLVGKPAPSIQAVQALLDADHVKPADVGGPLARSISARYFIIHDTSTPNCSADGPSTACPTRGEFPPNRDDAGWIYNKNFGGHPKPAPHRLAHAFTNRVGASITEVDFADMIATTKFESCNASNAMTKLFVGVENIQPRIGIPRIPQPGKAANDFDAPNPGFTPPQYDRLALLYVVASARRGQWLIPAFHAVLDQYYADGHDDPQHFDMAAFSAAVQKHAAALPAAGSVPQATAAPQTHDDLRKHALPALDAAACHQIAARADSFAAEKTSKTTQYFTPMFPPGPDGGLRDEDRHNCLNVEGSCIVGNFLYNAGGPNGKRFDRDQVKFIFGQGTGANAYNNTNALIPCRTLAADTNHYAIGTVIYVPAFQGKTCPQNDQPVDGCFIVGDVGSKIKGPGRFDIFTGECARYDGNSNSCRDKGNAAFNVPAGTAFRVVPRESEPAGALRKEVDAVIDNGWRPVSP
jgi:3D (Asp-Asp-Asp) domain-containing protein